MNLTDCESPRPFRTKGFTNSSYFDQTGQEWRKERNSHNLAPTCRQKMSKQLRKHTSSWELRFRHAFTPTQKNSWEEGCKGLGCITEQGGCIIPEIHPTCAGPLWILQESSSDQREGGDAVRCFAIWMHWIAILFKQVGVFIIKNQNTMEGFQGALPPVQYAFCLWILSALGLKRIFKCFQSPPSSLFTYTIINLSGIQFKLDENGLAWVYGRAWDREAIFCIFPPDGSSPRLSTSVIFICKHYFSASLFKFRPLCDSLIVCIVYTSD